MSVHARARWLLVLATAFVVAATWESMDRQRTTAERTLELGHQADRMLTAMVDQETGLRGYWQTGEEQFLEPYRFGRQAFEEALQAFGVALDPGDRVTAGLLAAQTRAARTWQIDAEEGIQSQRRARTPTRSDAERRKAKMDEYRARFAALRARVRQIGPAAMVRARDLAVTTIGGGALVVGLLGLLLVERGARADRRQREHADEFHGALQGADSEEEVQDLLSRQIARSLGGEADAVVLSRNHSADRLLPRTQVPDVGPLRARLAEAAPRQCLSVRRAAAHLRGESEPLARCELCGELPVPTSCTPSLVGGEVIGSVLVLKPTPVRPVEQRLVEEAVAQAAPVLANLRNLAVAEERASTDVLTGLPNNRAVQETLGRMVAQAGRSVSPLSALVVDLDHFKALNDRYGHQVGDEVLALVGKALRDEPRASDFAGRWGGEEFVVLLPDTDSEGAWVAAEKIRAAIGTIEVPGAGRRVTASVGVASVPEHASTGEGLLRRADRALYEAKGLGRNRVEIARAGDSVEEAGDVGDR